MKRLFAVMVAVIGMVIAAASLGLSASAYPPGTGPTIALSSTSVPQGGTDTVTGANFTPNSHAVLSLHSTPVGLGTVSTDSKGQFSAQITIPAGTTPGTHTVEAVDTPTGDIATATLTVTAGGGGGGGTTPPVAGTGVAILSIGGVGLALLVGGGFLVMAGRRRKATAA